MAKRTNLMALAICGSLLVTAPAFAQSSGGHSGAGRNSGGNARKFETQSPSRSDTVSSVDGTEHDSARTDTTTHSE